MTNTGFDALNLLHGDKRQRFRFDLTALILLFLFSSGLLFSPHTFTMSDNSSSPSNSSVHLVPSVCESFKNDLVINGLFLFIRLCFLLSLSISILYLGYQQWRQQRSFKTASHSDVITYHVAIMNLIWTLGAVFYFVGLYWDFPPLVTVGYFFLSSIFYEEILFHVLTCVDRYLAVVHPVTYRGLRNSRGDMIRNIGIFSVWLLSFLFNSAAEYNQVLSLLLFICVLVTSLVVVSFCSISVLCALTRPGPGEQGRVDQSKQRAFFTVMAILGALSFWLFGFLVSSVLKISQLSKSVTCLIQASFVWFSLPSSLVLPLLYLHKNGKFSCGRHNTG